ncbi:hypothetical protein D3C87_1688850 [compost metagenome]
MSHFKCIRTFTHPAKCQREVFVLVLQLDPELFGELEAGIDPDFVQQPYGRDVLRLRQGSRHADGFRIAVHVVRAVSAEALLFVAKYGIIGEFSGFERRCVCNQRFEG